MPANDGSRDVIFFATTGTQKAFNRGGVIKTSKTNYQEIGDQTTTDLAEIITYDDIVDNRYTGVAYYGG